MQKLAIQLKGMATEGKIPMEKVIDLAIPLDEEREATAELLKTLKTQVGQYHGEKIMEHLARMEGRKFNAVAYNHDRLPDSQMI